MRLIALLCWWDERPSWLAATIGSLARIGVDHVVAVDGAYAGFAEGTARSGFEQAEQIALTCDSLNIGLTLHRPKDLWMLGEPEKRTHLFQLAACEAEVGTDWLFAIDADEVVTRGTPRIKQELAAADYHVASAYLWQRDDNDVPGVARVARQVDVPNSHGTMQTRFFRAMDDMRAEITHYLYCGTLYDTRYLLRCHGDAVGATLPYAHALPHMPECIVEIEHRDQWRDMHRASIKRDYYRYRNETGIEAAR